MVINMVAIIDYDAGNIKSVEKALHYLGEEAVITRDREIDPWGRQSHPARRGSFWRCHGEAENI